MNLLTLQQKVLGGFPQLDLLYSVKGEVGSGAFGEIYVATHNVKKTKVAIKVEKKANDPRHQTLPKEAGIMKTLGNSTGFPQIIQFAESSRNLVIIQKLLGFNLEKLLKMCGQKFSLKTTILLAEQMIQRLETTHSKGIIHRDIKPENFLMGNDSDNIHVLHLIDFGLSKSFKEKNGSQIPMTERKGIVGTVRYCSINSHKGKELSRRDDLVSIAYLLIYFLKGRLPWQDLPIDDRMEKYQKIQMIKETISIDILCDQIPQEFKFFLKYSQSLNYFEKPNYSMLLSMFRELFEKLNFARDNQYDWVQSKEILRKYPKHVLQGLPSPTDASVNSHDYNKESMSEGPKSIKINPAITGFAGAKLNPKLGAFLEGNKGLFGSKSRSIKTKNEVLQRANLHTNPLLEYFFTIHLKDQQMHGRKPFNQEEEESMVHRTSRLNCINASVGQWSFGGVSVNQINEGKSMNQFSKGGDTTSRKMPTKSSLVYNHNKSVLSHPLAAAEDFDEEDLDEFHQENFSHINHTNMVVHRIDSGISHEDFLTSKKGKLKSLI